MADRKEAPERSTGWTPPLVERTVPPGSDERAGAVWVLKEDISRREGLLTQRRPFFDAQYRQSTCYLSVALVCDRGRGAIDVGNVVGFALVRPDGYLSLLGVAPGYRRQGVASRLLDRAVLDHPEVTCHVRATNADAFAFYADRGFLVENRVRGYYRDGTDAYRLARDPDRAEGVLDALD